MRYRQPVQLPPHLGVRPEVVERRRYGRADFYTWVEFVGPDGRRHCPDPWPAVRPPRSWLEETCARVAAGADVGLVVGAGGA